LETVLIAYPGHSAARELLALVEEGQASPPPPPRSEETHSEGRKDAFDLAAELASELGQLEDGEVADAGPATEDFQYSVAEVFAEFKKGLEKVVRPEDVDTHYDLGIAYREMGLTEDAIGEFTVAREGCVGKKKEIDCLTMIAMLQKAKGDLPAAIDSYKRALTSEHAVGDMEKALEFELAVLWEGSATAGKALYHYARVAKLDPQYRDVAKIVSRLSLTAKPEPDPLPAKKAFGGPSSTGLGGAKASYSKLQGS
jgi:tetratricopeptide (TPR) repeat protein